MKMNLCILLLSLVPILTNAADTPTSPFRDKLTGDWGGVRTNAAAYGVTFELDSTHYFQGLLAGAGDRDVKYGGRLDSYLNLDSTKLGWWDGGVIRVHGEYFYGDLDSNLGGTVLPTNVGVKLPLSGGDQWEATSIHLVQKLNDRMTLIAGKINTVDLLAGHPFFGGSGEQRFLSLPLVAPPNGLLPPSMLGGILSVNTAPISWTFMVFDPNDYTEEYGLDDAFKDGVAFAATGKYNFALAARGASLAITGIYSAKDGANLGEIFLDDSLKTGDKKGSWHASVQFDHFLHETSPDSGWGVFVKAGVSDGNPNPYQSFVAGGIGGKGLASSRPNDTFGVGYFYYNFSNDLQNTINPTLRFDDEQGIEAYYNAAVTPWLSVAVDMQYIDPAPGNTDNAFVGGTRMRLRF